MAGFGFDAGALRAAGQAGDMYVVVQVVLTEKFIGTGSGVSSLTNLQKTINEQAAKGYRLHTISTAKVGVKVSPAGIESRRHWCSRRFINPKYTSKQEG